ncbi:MAG TPA: YjcZ family sporulation protein [Bacillales bacterium]|nr:YjcZ family sporulation protein [Bacillales bacterium]
MGSKAPNYGNPQFVSPESFGPQTAGAGFSAGSPYGPQFAGPESHGQMISPAMMYGVSPATPAVFGPQTYGAFPYAGMPFAGYPYAAGAALPCGKGVAAAPAVHGQNPFALIVVLFILLIIIGAVRVY